LPALASLPSRLALRPFLGPAPSHLCLASRCAPAAACSVGSPRGCAPPPCLGRCWPSSVKTSLALLLKVECAGESFPPHFPNSSTTVHFHQIHRSHRILRSLAHVWNRIDEPPFDKEVMRDFFLTAVCHCRWSSVLRHDATLASLSFENGAFASP
jgi:hypothetical protein